MNLEEIKDIATSEIEYKMWDVLLSCFQDYERDRHLVASVFKEVFCETVDRVLNGIIEEEEEDDD